MITAERANKGILITNSTFSLPAQNFAKDKPIELLDGDKLKNLLNNYLDSNSIKAISEKKSADSNDNIDFASIRNKYFDEHVGTIEIELNQYLKPMIDILDIPLKKINERRFKLKNNLIYLGDKKSINNIPQFGSHHKITSEKICEIINIFINQFKIIAEGYLTNLLTGKQIYSGKYNSDLISTLNLIFELYEKELCIKPPDGFEKLHQIFCSMWWDRFFDFLNNKMEKMILWSKIEITDENKDAFSKDMTLIIYSDVKENEYSHEMQEIMNRTKKGWDNREYFLILKKKFSPVINLILITKKNTRTEFLN